MQKNSLRMKGRRKASRTPTEASITCRPYSSGGARATDAVMRNFSSGGSYIEASRPYQSGTILLVRMIRYPSPPVEPMTGCPPSICLVEVKWLQPLAEGDDLRFGMGLRCLE